MSQITNGARAVLSHPRVYNSLQNLLRKGNSIDRILFDIAGLSPTESMLDVGCGTGRLLERVPPGVEYVGVDLSAAYIEHARRLYGARAEFVCADVAQGLDDKRRFDLILATGLLHHLDDNEVLALFAALKRLLAPGGRIVTLDPTYLDRQRVLARAMIRRDRGQNVRYPDGYTALANAVFAEVSPRLLHDMLRIPYDHIALTLG